MWAVLVQPDSIGIEDEDAVIAERDFFRLPGGFVAVVGVPTGVADPGYSDKFVVIGRDPLLDGLPGRLDGLESLDVERGIRWWWNVDEPFPHAQQPQKKLDLLGLNKGFDSAHGAFATGALEGIGSVTRHIVVCLVDIEQRRLSFECRRES